MLVWVNRSSLVLLIILWGFTAIHFGDLPETIPTHFNALGEPDKFSSKTHCWGIPILALLLYLLLNQVLKRKEIQPKEFKVISCLQLSLIMIFGYIQLSSFLVALSRTEGLGRGFLPISILLLVVPSIWVILQKNKAE